MTCARDCTCTVHRAIIVALKYGDRKKCGRSFNSVRRHCSSFTAKDNGASIKNGIEVNDVKHINVRPDAVNL